MASLRNSANETQDAILDAARTCILEFGVRRTTMTAIAKAAGVSRMTAYRHYPDAKGLIADLITREIIELLPAGLGRDRPLVEDLVVTTARVRHDALTERILDVDPEILIPYVFDRLGSSQLAVLAALEGAIVAGQRDGTIRPGDPERLAAMVLLIVQSTMYSARTVRERLDDEHLDVELRIVLQGYLEARS